MLSRLRDKMSPAALVIALIALFAAIGGGAAIALPGKKVIDKNDLKKNVIASKNVINDGLTGDDIKEGTLSIPASAQNYFGASVTDTAQVTTATLPGTSASIDGAGAYTVTFPRSVQGCIPVVSDNTGGPATAARAFVAGGSPPTRVFVAVGTGSDGFNIIVIC
jgi:hypothetical protein